jgi:hypothetical protein
MSVQLVGRKSDRYDPTGKTTEASPYLYSARHLVASSEPHADAKVECAEGGDCDTLLCRQDLSDSRFPVVVDGCWLDWTGRSPASEETS